MSITNNLKEIEVEAKKFNSVEEVKKQLKSIQSKKCRLLKQKNRIDYDYQLRMTLDEEQLLKEVRSYLEPTKIKVTKMTKNDIDLLTFDETIKAIKSIQSKKSMTQFEDDVTSFDSDYQSALRIESLLKEHRSKVQPLNDNVVSKSRINDLIDNLSNLDEKIDKEYILKQLQELL